MTAHLDIPASNRSQRAFELLALGALCHGWRRKHGLFLLAAGMLASAPAEAQLDTAPLPSKTISLSLMSSHDPKSINFDGNCTDCHGTRTQEVALDGVTPTAHSIMLIDFGEGNERCIGCHWNPPNYAGPDFLNESAGGLRKQVNYEAAGCTECHAKGTLQPLYDLY